MPYYDLRCEDCKTESNIKATMDEKTSGQLRCPDCGSDKLQTVYKKVNILRHRDKDCDACHAGVLPRGGCGGGLCGPGARH